MSAEEIATATEVVRDALREYVGDGEGHDLLVLARHNEGVRTKALHEAANFVDSQRYIDEPADLRQVRDRLRGLADGTWEPEA